ncbi:MAG: hypothetical protein AAB262_12910 [Elusimicrobiota bacterium]
MDQQPKIPTLKESQKPQVKVRGIGSGLTLAERLKQFKKKDLAFILAGLGVLFMAPLAEHFMMAPESADGSLQAGWGRGGSGAGVFGAGGSPYDRTDGLAPGSPTGGGSDVITPLNVRDPSALVMGPAGTQQPPTNSALPPVSAPSARSDSDLKDALAASARGIGAAAKKAPLPIPKVALGGSGLRGLSVAGGGSSASAGLGPISAGNVPNRAAGGDSTGNARSTKGFSGVARGQTSGGGGIDALKSAAGRQGDNLNRGSGAASDLNAAANTAIPSGGSGYGGGPGAGKDDKGMGGNQDKGNKTVGESLAFLNMKARMEKDLELEYKKREINDFELLWGQMRNEGLKTLMSETVKAVASVWTGGLKDALTPEKAKQEYRCSGGRPVIPASQVGKCGEKGLQASDGGAPWTIYSCLDGKVNSNDKVAWACSKIDTADDSKTTDGKGPVVDKVNDASSLISDGSVKGLKQSCEDLGKMAKAAGAQAVGSGGDGDAQAARDASAKLAAYATAMKSRAALVVQVRDAILDGKGKVNECDASITALDVSAPVMPQQSKIVADLSAEKGTLSQLMASVSAKEGVVAAYDVTPIQTADDDLKKVSAVKPESILVNAPSAKEQELALRSLYGTSGISGAQGYLAAVETATTKVRAAVGQLESVQKNLNEVKPRLAAATGEKGTVTGVVKVNGAYAKLVGDPEADSDFKDFTTQAIGKPALVNGKGSPSKEVGTAITTAQTDVGTVAEPFAAYKKAKASEDEVATKAAFAPANQAAVKASASVDKMRTVQGDEINSMYTTVKASDSLMTGAKAEAQAAK